jgi:hypothetical protein
MAMDTYTQHIGQEVRTQQHLLCLIHLWLTHFLTRCGWLFFLSDKHWWHLPFHNLTNYTMSWPLKNDRCLRDWECIKFSQSEQFYPELTSKKYRVCQVFQGFSIHHISTIWPIVLWVDLQKSQVFQRFRIYQISTIWPIALWVAFKQCQVWQVFRIYQNFTIWPIALWVACTHCQVFRIYQIFVILLVVQCGHASRSRWNQVFVGFKN